MNTNSIASIAVGAFTGLANLTTLYVIKLDPDPGFFSFYCHDRSLFSNRLTVIESGVFAGLSKLQILFVNEFDCRLVLDSFRANRALTNNRIPSIDSTMFPGLGTLNSLFDCGVNTFAMTAI